MFHGPLHGVANCGNRPIATAVKDFHAHQFGIRGYSGLCARRAVAAYYACTMRSVTSVIHRVVVVIDKVITVVGVFTATIPKMVGKVDVVVVDTRVEDGHHDALSRIAQIPHVIGIYLGDVVSDSPIHLGRCLFFVKQGVSHFIITDDFYVTTHGQVVDGLFGGGEAQGIGHPQVGWGGGHAVSFHFVE